MTLQFSKEGPAFPSQLVDALLTGDVVFLCGAGVSAPQLPGFDTLVEDCFADLNVQMNASEKQAFDDCRYEEVLGSLKRRIVDPVLILRTVVKLLQPPADLNLDNHRTILRLSRNMENQPTIVTTNFDTLIERALLEKVEAESIRSLSAAGQDLPAPGSAGFGGIIHLHGRIADEKLKLDETALVLTSANYGDAYMRSGWASRFLFDLCRTKTIVLVGYNAGDAPFRYFLNVLEADRERFPDLCPVYALTPVGDRNEVDVKWSTLAVEAIPYEYVPDTETGKDSHSAIWRDLGKLAEVVERPRSTRRAWAVTILEKPIDLASPEDLDRVKWLFADRRDLWSVAIKTIIDPKWFEFFAQSKLWSDHDATWVIAAWIARDPQSADNYKLAVSWLTRLGTPFADEVDRRLLQAEDLPALWIRAWRILTKSAPEAVRNFDIVPVHSMMKRLRGPLLLNMDIHEAIGLLTPKLRIEPNRSYFYGGKAPNVPLRLSDLAWTKFIVPDRSDISELIDALVEVHQPTKMISLATQNLSAVIQLGIDVEDIGGDYDSMSDSVPSIESHDQNKHREGPIFLIELIARLLSIAIDEDRDQVRNLAESWNQLPGMLGLRLWLHALRQPRLFTSNEAMAGLVALSLDAFWTVRREIPLVLLERSGDTDTNMVARIEARILSEAGKYYERFDLDDGQVDWRKHARDTAVWLRLKMLDRAGVISDAGRTELATILERRNHLDRDVEDRDFFGSYSFGLRSVVGDAQPILEAPDDLRLEIAHKALSSQDMDKKEGWRAYCYADPKGAFDTLSKSAFKEANTPLWRDFVNSLSTPDKELDAATRELVISTFEILWTAPDSFLTTIILQLADLYTRSPRDELPEHEGWWARLFAVSVACDTEPVDPDPRLYDAAINSPGGRLTEAALIDIQSFRKADTNIPSRFLDAVTSAASENGWQGTMARAVLIHNISFVMSIEGQNAVTSLTAALSGETSEAVGLRAVLISQGNISMKASKAFSDAIKQGLQELDGNRSDAVAAAASVLSPAISIIRGETSSEDWGVSLNDVSGILRDGSPALREGATDVLRQWITQIEGGPAQTWRTIIGPLIDRVWPRERILRESNLTRHFTELAVSSEEAFPEAFEQLRPYLMRINRNGSVFSIKNSEVPEKFPQQTLSLLWHLFGPGHTGDHFGVPDILERLIKADPEIELDRRLQWLDQNAVHHD
ncbi:SIR2 family protein [Falsihalocynthiibacter arcticus]|uniref:SIR2 family protein n=1 Tax=Falsihalocynthiibacter arcticus TaxID=1579316 RepID=UPI003001D3FE